MNFAAATLWVQDTAYVVRDLFQQMHQPTTGRGIPSSLPNSGELRLVLDHLPHDVLLPTWAFTPRQILPARVVFDALDGLSASLTIELEEAYCVSYEEHFESNALGHASHYCVVSIVARRLVKQGVPFVNQWAENTQ